MDLSSLHSFAVIYDPYGLNNDLIVKTFNDLGLRVLCNDDFVSAPPSSDDIRGVFISQNINQILKAQSKVRMVFIPTSEQLCSVAGGYAEHVRVISSWRFDVVVQNVFELTDFAQTVFTTLDNFGIVEAPVVSVAEPSDDLAELSANPVKEARVNLPESGNTEGCSIGVFESFPEDDTEIRGEHETRVLIPSVSSFKLHVIEIPHEYGPELTFDKVEDFCRQAYTKASSKRFGSLFMLSGSYYNRNFLEFISRNRLVELGISNALGHIDRYRSRMILFRDSPFIFFEVSLGRGLYIHAGLLYGGMIQGG